MASYYPPKIIAILIAMILTGAARSVCVKIFYQMGFVNPLFVTLLYLLGHSLALTVYGISRYLEKRDTGKNESRHTTGLNSLISRSLHRTSLHDVLGSMLNDDGGPGSAESSTEETDASGVHVSFWGVLPMGSFDHGKVASTPNGNHIEMMMVQESSLANGSSTNTQATQWGSAAGLNEESKAAVQWVHSIPWYMKPVIPGLCNLLKSALRWASLVYIAASVAEILISGLELVFSVWAARLIRKRRVATARWIGVGLVLVGIVWVGLVDAMGNKQNDDETTTTSHTITGLLLILAQSLVSATQDIAEEIFMDEAHFPATLLLGMEGLLGFIVGLVLYVPAAPLLNEDPISAWNHFASPSISLYGMFLVALFLVNGIANILTTCATSSMTRNVWKNIRTALVWILGLLIFYAAQYSGGSSTLGEPWETPKSFMLLVGFIIMLAGIYTYYHRPTKQEQPRESFDDQFLRQGGDSIALENTDIVKSMGSMVTVGHGNTVMRHRAKVVPSPTFQMHAIVSDETRRGRLESTP